MDKAYYTAGNKQNMKRKMPPKASEKCRLIPAVHRGVLCRAAPLGTRKRRLPKMRLVPSGKIVPGSEFLCATYEMLLD